MTLWTLEGDHIRTVLESTNWRIRGAGGAAERLGSADDARKPDGAARNRAKEGELDS